MKYIQSLIAIAVVTMDNVSARTQPEPIPLIPKPMLMNETNDEPGYAYEFGNKVFVKRSTANYFPWEQAMPKCPKTEKE